jgi:hypothetical protein
VLITLCDKVKGVLESATPPAPPVVAALSNTLRSVVSVPGYVRRFEVGFCELLFDRFSQVFLPKVRAERFCCALCLAP